MAAVTVPITTQAVMTYPPPSMAAVTVPITTQAVMTYGARTTLGSGIACTPPASPAPFSVSGCAIRLSAGDVGGIKGAAVRVMYSAKLHTQVGLRGFTGLG
jgi:hypothetical protein